MSKRNRQPPASPHGQLIATRGEIRIAPLPKPEELAHFDQILPGLAERIVAMAEGNARDRWRTNRTHRVLALLGPLLAFVVVLSAIAAGVFLTARGMNVAGIAAILTALATPLVAFIYRNRK